MEHWACSRNASITCKVNGNAISNCSEASSGALCPSTDPCWVGRQVRWQSHPLGRGVYILDDTYFMILQRGVFDILKLFLNLASSRGTIQKAEPWTIARWPAWYAFSSVELRDQHSWYRLWNVNPWIWEAVSHLGELIHSLAMTRAFCIDYSVKPDVVIHLLCSFC